MAKATPQGWLKQPHKEDVMLLSDEEDAEVEEKRLDKKA